MSPPPRQTNARRRFRIHGRDPELEAVGELLTEVRAGHGRVVLIDGPAGIGKTRLLGEVETMARRNGFRLATGRVASGDGPAPLALLLEALFDGEQPLFGADVLHQLSSAKDQRYWLVQELQVLLAQAALERPLLITLDDLQRADAETLAAMRRLTAGLSDVPVAWVLAARTEEARPELMAGIDRLVPDGPDRLALARLSDTAVTELVGDVVGGPAGEQLLELAVRTRGNPLLVVELFEGLVNDRMILRKDGEPAELQGDGLPSRFHDAVSRRIDCLEPETSQMVRVASVLGRFTVEHLACMLDVAPARLLGPLTQAIRADLFTDAEGHLTFSCDLVREAAMAAMPDTMRRSLHRRAADVLRAAGAGPVATGHHLAASAERGDREALTGLRAAAEALGGSDPGQAADLSRTALDLIGEDDPERGVVVAETVVLLDAALRSAEADGLAASALEGVLPTAHQARIRLGLAALSERSADARAADNRCALRFDDLPATMRARHLALLPLNLTFAGRFSEAEAHVAPAAAAAHACGDETARGALRLAEALLEEARGGYVGALELTAEGLRGPPSGAEARAQDGAARVGHARLLSVVGDLNEALRLSATGVARAERDGQLWLLGQWRRTRAQLLLDAGDLDGARAEAEAVQSLVSGMPSSPSALNATLLLGRIALHTDDRRQLRASLRAARELQADSVPVVRRDAAWLVALAAFDDRQAAEAVSWLEEDERLYSTTFCTRAPRVVQIALAAGRPELGAEVVERAERLAALNPGTTMLKAVAVHARGLLEENQELLLSAVALLRGAGRPLALAAALEDLSVALEPGRGEQAGRCAEEALELWERAGALADARRVRRRFRALGVRRYGAATSRPKCGWGSLTDSELTVVRLVAEAHTNRQVAERLVLSPHTVSTHLRHAFAKLEINSRVELARVVLDHELDNALAA